MANEQTPETKKSIFIVGPAQGAEEVLEEAAAAAEVQVEQEAQFCARQKEAQVAATAGNGGFQQAITEFEDPEGANPGADHPPYSVQKSTDDLASELVLGKSGAVIDEGIDYNELLEKGIAPERSPDSVKEEKKPVPTQIPVAPESNSDKSLARATKKSMTAGIDALSGYFQKAFGAERPGHKYKARRMVGDHWEYEYDEPKEGGHGQGQIKLEMHEAPKSIAPVEHELKDLPIGKAPEKKAEAFSGKAFTAGDVVSGKAPYKPGEALHPDHKDESSAYIIDDYPYGSMRTKMKVWIESDSKGKQRYMAQTLNPKTNKWNNPKASTYSDALVGVFDEKGHIGTHGYNLPYRNEGQIPKFLEKFGGHLTPAQRTDAELMHHYDYLTKEKGVESKEALIAAKKKWIQNMKDRGIAKEMGDKAKAESEAKKAKTEAKKGGPTGPAPDISTYVYQGGHKLPDIHELAGLSHAQFTAKFELGSGASWGYRHWASKSYAELAKKAADANRNKLATQYKHLSVAARRVGGYQSDGQPMNGADQMTKFLAHAEKHGTDKDKLDKSFGGIMTLEEYLAKAEGLPTGEAKLEQGHSESSPNGGSLESTPKPGTDGKAGPSSDAGAPSVPEDKLSADDEAIASQLKGGEPGMVEQSVSTAKSMTGYTRQELEHTIARQKAAWEYNLRKGQADVTVGVGVVSGKAAPEVLEKAQYSVQGEEARVLYSNSSDLECEKLFKSDFYQGGEPTLGFTSGQLAQSKRCGACNGVMSKSLTACPHCGTGAVVPNLELSKSEASPMNGGLRLRPSRKEADLYIPHGTKATKE